MARPSHPSAQPPVSAWRRWWQRWLGGSSQATEDAGHAEKPAESRRSVRAARREQLYALVRENMIRAGVLSSSYKFKVLTLDHEGASHLVLIDIEAAALEAVPEGPLGMEAHLQQLAADRLQLEVRAIYWRTLQGSTQSRSPARPSVPPKPGHHTASEPGEDELAALHRALDAHRPRATPRSFEPTRPMLRSDQRRLDALGETQHGELE